VFSYCGEDFGKRPVSLTSIFLLGAYPKEGLKKYITCSCFFHNIREDEWENQLVGKLVILR
jgi:hypothetical protein